jgi:ATP-dependent DNA helicase RecQ
VLAALPQTRSPRRRASPGATTGAPTPGGRRALPSLDAEAAAALGGDAAGEALFQALKKLRKQIADERGIPAYLVWSDATLRAMVVARPRTATDLLAVSGVGPVKLEAYGDRFLTLLRSFSAGASRM